MEALDILLKVFKRMSIFKARYSHINFYKPRFFTSRLALLSLFSCCLFFIVAACSISYQPQYLKASDVASSSALPIDGTWLLSSGSVVRIKQGNIYAENFAPVKKGGVIGKELRKDKPGEYRVNWLSWSTRKRVSHYGEAEISIESSSEVSVHFSDDPITDLEDKWDNCTRTLTSLHLENPYAYLTEWQTKKKARIEATELVIAYKNFLDKYPNSPHAHLVLNQWNSLIKTEWEKAKKEDKIYGYEKFIKIDPGSEFAEQARTRMAWQKENCAIVEIEYPKVLKSKKELVRTRSSLSKKDIYAWDTVFKETGGRTGYKFNRSMGYIKCPYSKFTNGLSGTWYSIEPNGEKTIDYWFTNVCGSSGGIYETTWKIEDDWGNKSSVVQTIQLQ